MATPERYELAWHYVWEGYSNWKQALIIDEPDTRQGKEFSKEFGHEVAELAESNKKIPSTKSKRAQAKTKAMLQPSGVK